MIKVDPESNAQAWELEVTCKNKEWLEEIVSAILRYGMIEFEVNTVGLPHHTEPGEWDGRYTVFMWCSWFGNLNNITKDLAEIEARFDK